MLTVDEALRLVLEHAQPLPAVEVDCADALDHVLAERVVSDVDSPPHDKSIVDGYAVFSSDLAGGTAELTVIEEVVAGAVPKKSLAAGQASRIMTGAPVPAGADAVVMVERTQAIAGLDGAERVRIVDASVRPGQNILPRGCSMRRGDTILEPGAWLRPIELGLLAEVGRSRVRVAPHPTVAVLSTGNELVPHDGTPSAGQIRNSNGPMLAASIRAAGAVAIELGIARDDRDELRRLVERGLAADVLVLSGGVSAGILDLVPEVLAELGVGQVFHKVRLKPGKPLWFGALPPQAPRQQATLVFGLPGNPVSSLVCFELFVRFAIDRLSGRESSSRLRTARLGAPFAHRGDRPTYHPGQLSEDGVKPTALPLAWRGSADLRTLAEANCLICFPAGDREYATGESVTARML
jgi:molybdopterin molybdotransferase